MSLIPRKYYLEDFFEDFANSKETVMKCDIYEKDGKCNIEIDVPGFDKKDINIECKNGYLTITAKKEEKHDDKDKNYIRKERSYSKTSRSFYIGGATEENVKAEFKDGILKVVVPKIEEKNTKKTIEIE